MSELRIEEEDGQVVIDLPDGLEPIRLSPDEAERLGRDVLCIAQELKD
jgi:hypothetical protein